MLFPFATLCSFAAAVLPLVIGPPRVLDRRAALYAEDEPSGRPVAAVDAALVEWRGEPRLLVAVSALGIGVVPALGADGVPAANLVTARELDRALREHRLRWILDDRAGPRREVRAHASSWQHVPLRRFDVTSARFVADRSWELLPVELLVWTLPLGSGRHELVAELDGRPRLCITVQIAGDAARVVAVESIGWRTVP